MDIVKKIITFVGDDVENWNPYTMLMGIQNRVASVKNILAVP
jgi:hypothetical protein